MADNNPALSDHLSGKRKHFETVFGWVVMEYRCEATSPAGFVQQLASCYLPHGYWFHVSGWIPQDKDAQRVDAKLMAKYGVAISRQSRARRKQIGLANIHYLRHGRFFVLLATHGHHVFFEEEADRIRDARRVPIQFAGYSIGVKKGGYRRKTSSQGPAIADDRWRVRVQIARETYRDLKASFLEMALRRTAEQLGRKLRDVPYEPYAPVRQQLLNVLRLVNETRKAAGLPQVSHTVLRYRRAIVRPFDVAEKAPVA